MDDYTPSEKAYIAIAIIGGAWVMFLSGSLLIFASGVTPLEFIEQIFGSPINVLLFLGCILILLIILRIFIRRHNNSTPDWLGELKLDSQSPKHTSRYKLRNRKNERYLSVILLVHCNVNSLSLFAIFDTRNFCYSVLVAITSIIWDPDLLLRLLH